MQKLHLSIPNTFWKKFKQGILLLAMLGLVTPVWAGVFQIQQVNGETKWFKVKRDGKVYPATELPKGAGFGKNAFLQDGDEVCVVKPPSITEDHQNGDRSGGMMDGKEYSVTLTNILQKVPPIEVGYSNYNCNFNQYFKVNATIPSGWQRFLPFFNNVAKTITQPYNDTRTRLKQAITRGKKNGDEKKPLSIPLLSSQENRLVIGKTKVYLGWSGGTPPYTVKIFDKSENEVAGNKTPISGEETEMPMKLTQDGAVYTVRVSDSKLKCADGKFTVVKSLPADNKLPTKEEDWKTLSATLPSETQEILPALWLLQNEKSKETWSFEAYQQIKSIKKVSCNDLLLPASIQSNTACFLMQGLKEGWDKMDTSH